MRSQIRKDLHAHADDKLFRWVTDTFDIYHTAELDSRDAAADVIFSMMTGIGALAAAFHLPPEAVRDYFMKHLATTKRKFDQQESRQ